MKNFLLETGDNLNNNCMDSLRVIKLTLRGKIVYKMANVKYCWNAMWENLIIEIVSFFCNENK